jgi:hypothetical protein
MVALAPSTAGGAVGLWQAARAKAGVVRKSAAPSATDANFIEILPEGPQTSTAAAPR